MRERNLRLMPDTIMIAIISLFAGGGVIWLVLCLSAWAERLLKHGAH